MQGKKVWKNQRTNDARVQMRTSDMRMYRLFFIIGFLLIANTAFPQGLPYMDYEKPREYEIAEINVSGLKYLDNEVLANLSGLSVGDVISVPGDDITDVIKKYWAQGLFSDVQVTASKIEGKKIWLDIYLQERPRLSRLAFRGIKKGATQDLMEKIDLKSGSQITDEVINNAKQVIKKHFVEKGFYNTEIGVIERRDTTLSNRVMLTFVVDKNEKVKIDDIVFTGNKSFTDKKLRRKLKNTKKVNWNIFKASRLIRSDFKEDKQKLIDFYNQEGFRDATIVEDSVVRISEDRLMVYITIREGRKYYFGDIEWVGNTVYSDEMLNAAFGVNKGEVFNQTLMEERLLIDEDAVNSLYLDNGYLFSSITPVEQSIAGDTINMEMRVYEGKQATINEVIISGNTKTNEHVVRREIRTKPGELFSKSDIIRTVRELAQLGHFDPEKIEPVPMPDPVNGTVDLEYKLVEKANDQLEVSGGWGANMLVGTIGLRFSNFSARNIFKPSAWRPIPTGDGQTLSLRAQSNGRYYRSYNFTFVEPWFGGKKPNSFSVSVYNSKRSRMSYWERNADIEGSLTVTGASVGLGRRLKWPDDFFTLYNELSYQNYSLDEFPGYFSFPDGSSNNISFRTTFGRNSIDNPIYPRRGSNFSVGLQFTPPYSLFQPDRNYADMTDNEKYKFIEYHKWTFNSEWYTRIVDDLVLSTRMRFGYLAHYNDEIGPSPFEGFDLGGDGLSGYNLYGRETIALRGYDNGTLTPIVNGAKAGNLFTKYTVELRYPITLQPQATVFVQAFVEAGDAWYDFESFNPFLVKRSAGVGLRAFLPMFGLLGIDWGFGFDDVPGRPGANGGQFHFTIGQQF